ncbi:MAG: ATP-binding cassette domain-containing protein [Adhaeribacter sp.]
MIQIQHLHFGYSRRAPLFKDLNLDLERGHIYGLLGKNGAGKSTLLKNMVGLAYPDQGRCLVHGRDISGRSPELLADIFFLPEEIYVPAITAERFVANTACFYPHFSETEFYHYLQEFEVPREAYLDKMSFGQQKKMMIAFGLATNTSILVMDEPTNGLDIPSKVQFRKIVASALSEDRCIIISTHQVRDLDSLIDTLLVLHDHRIVLHEDLDSLADRLFFTSLPASGANGREVLYEESSVRGRQVILPNLEGQYSRVDLELLFNGIISGNESLTQTLSSRQYEKSL